MNHHTDDPVVVRTELAEVAGALAAHTAAPTGATEVRLTTLADHLAVRATEVAGSWAEDGYRAYTTLVRCALDDGPFDRDVTRTAGSVLAAAVARAEAEAAALVAVYA